MMLLILDSALRSLLFGISAWALLRVLCVRHTGTETIVWTSVLAVAVTMPLLSHYLPQWVLVLTFPPAGAQQSAIAASARTSDGGLPSGWWLLGHAQAGLVTVYALVVVVYLARLAIGLLQSVRLCLSAERIEANWVGGRHIRVSAALNSPASVARVILLPADHGNWSMVKREAVLAHEDSHVARGDFFVQLLASIHCAFFWFSPFAWWLQSKLAEVAETASDEAAVRRLNDRVTYAEVLLEVARRAQQLPSIIAMAKGPFIEQRVERILSDTSGKQMSGPLRALVIGCLPVLALPLASGRAALGDLPVITLAQAVFPPKVAGNAVQPEKQSPAASGSSSRPHRQVTRVARTVARTPTVSHDRQEAVSYNPRALLDSASVSGRRLLPASTIVHAGKTFYIRSSEAPVASVADENAAGQRNN